jgi:hypothetical protein
LSEKDRPVKKPKEISDTLLLLISSLYGRSYQWVKTGEGEMFLSRIAEEATAYGIDFSNRDIKDILEKISFIYNHGNEDQKAQLYGHILRLYNGIQQGGSDKDGGESGFIREIHEFERTKTRRDKKTG